MPDRRTCCFIPTQGTGSSKSQSEPTADTKKVAANPLMQAHLARLQEALPLADAHSPLLWPLSRGNLGLECLGKHGVAGRACRCANIPHDCAKKQVPASAQPGQGALLCKHGAHPLHYLQCPCHALPHAHVSPHPPSMPQLSAPSHSCNPWATSRPLCDAAAADAVPPLLLCLCLLPEPFCVLVVAAACCSSSICMGMASLPGPGSTSMPSVLSPVSAPPCAGSCGCRADLVRQGSSSPCTSHVFCCRGTALALP